MDDVELVREVYDASYRRLVTQLTGVTGSLAEAEDVVQEAFVRAVTHAGTVRRADNPEAWLRRVAVNVARSRLRRARRWNGLVPRLVGHDERVPAADLADDLAADRVALMDALRRLPGAQREAIALHHLADLPVHEVAATLGVPTGTVKARLSRGRAALAALLGEPPEQPAVPSTEEARRG
ncbi:MAG TPA: sigma-70 family RNA polymerase sigma factor [Nocardioidaceae bacterium]|nr:sigma-70 family RNA polymerase sigma factor [Nocardioidaceae bacterium]